MIGAVENGIIAQLRSRSEDGTLGYSYLTLNTYPDDFDQYLAAKKGQFRAPAAWAVFLSLGDCTDPQDGSGVQGDARFALIVAAQNLRNETASRHGGPNAQAEPGSYQLAVDAARILSRNDLGLDLVKPISVVGMRLVQRTRMMAENNLSLMAVELRCTVPLGEFASVGEGDFTMLHVDWDVPPHGNVAPPLPAAEADARDDMELPQ